MLGGVLLRQRRLIPAGILSGSRHRSGACGKIISKIAWQHCLFRGPHRLPFQADAVTQLSLSAESGYAQRQSQTDRLNDLAQPRLTCPLLLLDADVLQRYTWGLMLQDDLLLIGLLTIRYGMCHEGKDRC